MKILVFNWRDITHPWAGGAERHLHELAKRWVKGENKVSFIVGGYNGALRKEEIDGVEIVRIGDTYTNFILGPLYYLVRARNRGFDCLIDTAHGIPYFLPLFTRTPVVLVLHHNHEKLWKTEFGNLVSKIGIFIENKIVPLIYRKSLVITLSQSEKDSLKTNGFRNVEAVPPGINNSPIPRIEKTRYPTILYLGRLRKYKRADFLIDIFPRIKRKVKNTVLIVAGDGQDKARVENIIRRSSFKKDIILKGFVSEEEKFKLLQSSWVLAFPSLMEGWGLVVMEAAICGTPAVGFKVPGVYDAIKDNESGLLSNSKREFTENLTEILLNKRLRKRLSRGALDWAKNFDWEKSSSRFFKILQRASHGFVEGKAYGKRYFESFWRRSYLRKFHPVYDFRLWYICRYLKPKDLLDVGCGSGWLVKSLLAKGVKAYGVDISNYAISGVGRRYKNNFFVGDILKIPKKDNSFDIVSCIDVLEHIRGEDLQRAIKECGRIGKRAIYFDITVLEDFLFIFFDKTHVSKFFSWRWQEIIKRALGNQWIVRRGPILPFIHHGIFIADKIK